MSPEVQSRIFDPFFTTKPPGQGTGLGLATVYGIVKQSGGEIVLHSELHAGSMFRIYLPTAYASDQHATVPEATALDDLVGSETILVVEDNAALRRLAQRVLAHYGYVVLSAQNGTEALNICSRFDGTIHAVLIDIIMPGDSGPTVITSIARERPGISVVYMSGYAGGVRSSDLSTGPNVFLHKPFTSLQLARAIRQVLQRPTGAP
jgi:two-component system, cell cycle sensor histidine kinase and response regulator CckA